MQFSDLLELNFYQDPKLRPNQHDDSVGWCQLSAIVKKWENENQSGTDAAMALCEWRCQDSERNRRKLWAIDNSETQTHL